MKLNIFISEHLRQNDNYKKRKVNSKHQNWAREGRKVIQLKVISYINKDIENKIEIKLLINNFVEYIKSELFCFEVFYYMKKKRVINGLRAVIK